MCPCCNNPFVFTRNQCTWCRRLVCHMCVIDVPKNRFDDGRAHNACRACFEARMTGQDKAASAFDELAKPDAGVDWASKMSELGLAVSGKLDLMAVAALLENAKP